MSVQLLDNPIDQLVGLSARELNIIESALAEEDALLKMRKTTLAAVFSRKYGDEARELLMHYGKDSGTVNISTAAGKLKAEFDKDVKWDQGKLKTILSNMSTIDAAHYAKYELSVSETKYNGAPPAIQAKLKEARTVRVRDPKFSFVVASDREAA